MTAREEDILTSRSFIEKGVVLDRLVQNIIINKNIKAEDLLVGDKAAILINARKNGYGADYETTISCPECGFSDSCAYDLDNSVIKDLPSEVQLEEAGITTTGNGTFRVILPLSGVEVEFRLLTGRDDLDMLRRAGRNRKRNEGEQVVTNQLSTITVAINEHTEKDLIRKFIGSLTIKDAQALRAAYDLVTPDINMKKDFVCSDCSYEDDINFPVTTDFFWPQR
jgi:hypothetical protein